jgi:hypothetical protein
MRKEQREEAYAAPQFRAASPKRSRSRSPKPLVNPLAGLFGNKGVLEGLLKDAAAGKQDAKDYREDPWMKELRANAGINPEKRRGNDLGFLKIEFDNAMEKLEQKRRRKTNPISDEEFDREAKKITSDYEKEKKRIEHHRYV